MTLIQRGEHGEVAPCFPASCPAPATRGSISFARACVSGQSGSLSSPARPQPHITLRVTRGFRRLFLKRAREITLPQQRGLGGTVATLDTLYKKVTGSAVILDTSVRDGHHKVGLSFEFRRKNQELVSRLQKRRTSLTQVRVAGRSSRTAPPRALLAVKVECFGRPQKDVDHPLPCLRSLPAAASNVTLLL